MGSDRDRRVERQRVGQLVTGIPTAATAHAATAHAATAHAATAHAATAHATATVHATPTVHATATVHAVSGPGPWTLALPQLERAVRGALAPGPWPVAVAPDRRPIGEVCRRRQPPCDREADVFAGGRAACKRMRTAGREEEREGALAREQLR